MSRRFRASAGERRLHTWLGALCWVCSLAACKKPESSGGGAASASPQASAAAPAATALLTAEWQRDASAVAETELLHPDAARRAQAVRALARIQDERSFARLAQALADEDADVVAWAAFGVGKACRGHEAEATRRLAVRAASAANRSPAPDERLLRALAGGLGRCASAEAEQTLRAWLRLEPSWSRAAALGLGQLARQRKHLDDASIAALLDAAEKAGATSYLYPLESVPALGSAARQRLLEVATPLLERPGDARAFAIRALAKAGPEASEPLGRVLKDAGSSDVERADAARALGVLGESGQAELASALEIRARELLEQKQWLSARHGALLALLDALQPQSGPVALLRELSQLPLEGEPAPVLRRKVMLRCRAAALLAGSASKSAALLACDAAPNDQRREGSLSLLRVLARGTLARGRGVSFSELAQSKDRVVREAALELLMTHEEVPNRAELLASALGAEEPGVRATAAKVLARYPARARLAGSTSAEDGGDAPIDPRVVRALTEQLAKIGGSKDIELQSLLLDAAAALELLGGKPALERACASSNATLREHAERGLVALGDRGKRCPAVPGRLAAPAPPRHSYRLELETDVGVLTLELWSDVAPFATERLVGLARSGFFDDMPVHRVVPGFVVQLGDPGGDGFGGADLPPLPCELGLDAFEPGSVGIALAGRDTGQSQFFVALRRAPHLDGEYSLIGHAAPGWERLSPGDRVHEVRVLEGGSN